MRIIEFRGKKNGNMSYYDKDFIGTFNAYYPFERYIVKEPKLMLNKKYLKK